MMMKIDDGECEFETGSARAGWVDLFKIGKDVNGRLIWAKAGA